MVQAKELVTSSRKTVERVPKTQTQEITAKKTLASLREKVMQGVGRKIREKFEDPDVKINRGVFQIMKDLLGVDEATLRSESHLRSIAERLQKISLDNNPNSKIARQARLCLFALLDEHKEKWLQDIVEKSLPFPGGVSDAVDALYQGTSDSLHRQKELRRLLVRYQKHLQYDPNGIHDVDEIKEYIKEIKRVAEKKRIPVGNVQEVIQRLQAVSDETTQTQLRQERKASMQERGFVTWKDVKDSATNPDLHKDNEVFSDFRQFTKEEIELLKNGKDGLDELYYNFMDEIFGLSKEEKRPDLPDTYKYEDIKNYSRWLHGEADYQRALENYNKLWAERGKYDAVIKSLLYKPGDIKDKIRAIRLLTGSDLDYFHKFDYANITTSLYEQVVRDKMSDQASYRLRQIAWLGEEIDNPLHPGQRISREQLWGYLRDKNNQIFEETVNGRVVKRVGTLTPAHQQLMKDIEKARDEVVAGVMLWDSDIQSYTEVYIELNSMENRRVELLRKPSLSGLEKKELEELVEKIERKRHVYDQAVQSAPQNLQKELNYKRGLSPIDQEVRLRLIAHLKSQGVIKVPEYKIRQAIWAARTSGIGSGRIPAIGSFMAIAPGLIPEEVMSRIKLISDPDIQKRLEGFYNDAKGKSVMRAPAFEDLQRFYNPILFAHRFGFGGPMGGLARDILNVNILEEKGYKVANLKEWKELLRKERDPEKRKLMMTLEFAEKNLGIPFEQMLMPGFFAAGGDFDGTTWRLALGVVDELRNAYLEMRAKLPPDAKIDNQALGIQLLITGMKTPEDFKQRAAILQKMMRRTPLIFFQSHPYLRDTILGKVGMSLEEWDVFKRALSVSEFQASTDKKLKFRDLDFGRPDHFQEVIVPILRDSFGITPDKYQKYLRVIQELQAELERERPVGEGRGRFKHSTLLESFAHHEFPLTVSLTDFDWSDANFHKLGTIAMDRRGRDNEAMAQAKDMMLDILSKPHVLSPVKMEDTAKAIYELKNMVNNYADPDTAERVALHMARVVLEINRNRAATLSKIGWIPGGVTIMRILSETDMRGWKDNRFLNFITGGAWANFADKKFSQWPHSIAQSISYASGHFGVDAPAWDEWKMGGFINTLDLMGVFAKNRDYIFDLRKEFGAGPGRRWWATLRKYWWVVPVATLSVAILKTAEEEEKKSSSH